MPSLLATLRRFLRGRPGAVAVLGWERRESRADAEAFFLKLVEESAAELVMEAAELPPEQRARTNYPELRLATLRWREEEGA